MSAPVRSVTGRPGRPGDRCSLPSQDVGGPLVGRRSTYRDTHLAKWTCWTLRSGRLPKAWLSLRWHDPLCQVSLWRGRFSTSVRGPAVASCLYMGAGQMRKRRRQPYRAPDGKDWRDPEMTVTRSVNRNGVWGLEEWPPEYNRRYMEYMHNMHLSLTWRKDPSYNWRRK